SISWRYGMSKKQNSVLWQIGLHEKKIFQIWIFAKKSITFALDFRKILTDIGLEKCKIYTLID
ncbi:MAG: hypothetical protein LBN18_01030, partial [Dysgonamonadaceae bacterium]|nr:hypothetical protein [Dysgonamonadaceae bacterium]